MATSHLWIVNTGNFAVFFTDSRFPTVCHSIGSGRQHCLDFGGRMFTVSFLASRNSSSTVHQFLPDENGKPWYTNKLPSHYEFVIHRGGKSFGCFIFF